MSEYRIECEHRSAQLEVGRWSLVFVVDRQGERIQEVVVTLSFRALGPLLTGLQDKGVERHDEEIASAVLRTEGKRRIRERLKVPGGRCPSEISINADDFLEAGKVEEVLREAGLL